MRSIVLAAVFILVMQEIALPQFCAGSLGDPTILIDFGSSALPPNPLTKENTSYSPATAPCPKPGEAGFRTLLFGCYDNAWNTIIADHTPNDLDGNYLLFNAGTKEGNFYVTTVKGLCPNTTYQLGVWMANVLKPGTCSNSIKPDVTLQVETPAGVILASYKTGIISETSGGISWKEYALTFKTPPSPDIVLRLINSAVTGGDCGNVLIMDDISFKPCGPVISAQIIKNGSSFLSVCEDLADATYMLQGQFGSGFANPVYQWQESNDFGLTWQDISGAITQNYLHTRRNAGLYYYRFGISEVGNGAACRMYSPRIVLAINQKPFVQVTKYVFGCYGDAVVIFAAGGSKYQWSGPHGFSSNLQYTVIDNAQFTDEGKYTVKITTDQGCSDTGSLNLRIYPAAHATIGPTVNTCEGKGVVLQAGGGTRYKWYPGDMLNNDSIATPIATVTDTTTFLMVASNEYGCTDTAYQTVNVWFKPTANAGADKRTRIGLPVTLDGSGTGTDIRYFWTPSAYMNDVNLLRPIVNTPQSAYYTLHAQSNKGCGEATDEVYIKVYDKIIIPNAFSPNGDGINDKWVIEPLDLFSELELRVFNRYGQVVYYTRNYGTAWDGNSNGKPLPVGTYYYILNLKIPNEKPMTGSITILR